MVKKLWIMGLMAINVFTLSNINAQVPSNYQQITLDLSYVADTNNTQMTDRDNTYFDLWSFINFQDAYIDINGFTVVSDGEAIPSATFNYDVEYGQAFELVYDDVAYYFSITELEVPGLDFTILSNSVYAFAVNGSLEIEDPQVIDLYLPDAEVVDQPDVSGGFLELLIGYGIYNTTGLLILFFVTLFAINVALAFLKVPSVVYITTNMAVSSGFIFFNLIPVWAGFIFLSVMALFLVISFKGAKL